MGATTYLRKIAPAADVEFADDDDHLCFSFPEALCDKPIPGSHRLSRIDQEQDDVSLGKGAVDHRVQPGPELVARLVQPGSVDEDDLIVSVLSGAVDDAANRVAGGLGPRGGDCDF